ncbi:MAG: cyclic nucleotide-binding domain-containing protein [Spirochaetaceae bacterium]|nr:cyclic nucleotide-binding domain-containing protein [Myxococcales bacterium]MCB9725393.1 cyclic nucleotide-binding domain-containing protein [Spirochaetaceae bacterium]HPG26500.1 cyclic nucleotide-binding domain-containing protein [Myxococcota bacterium]
MRPERLKRFSLFAEFNEEDRDALVELLEERRLPAGKSAFREGSEAEGLVLLVEGRLKLKSRRTGGVIGTIEACQHLGAASLFALGPREVTALADGPCTIWLLPRSGLPRLADDAPRTAFRLAEAVASELAGLARRGVRAAIDGEGGDGDE